MKHQLSAACKKQCEALGIDWAKLITTIEPIALQVIMALLTAFATPATPVMAKLKAAGDCIPDCCGACLDEQRDELVAALVANVHLRGCCPCPVPDPAS